MDDEAETYKLWRIRKTVMQVSFVMKNHAAMSNNNTILLSLLTTEDI